MAAGIGASRNFDILCGMREPGTPVVWDAWLPSPLTSGHEHVLHESFSKLNGFSFLQTASVAPCASEGVIWPKHLHDLGLAIPDDLAEALGPFDGLVQRLDPKHRPAA